MNKRIKMAFLGSLVGVSMLGATAFAESSAISLNSKGTELSASSKDEDVEAPGNWMYELKEDKLYGTKYHISTKSINEEDLGRGVISPMTLVLRERGENDYDVMLKLNGYFHCTPGLLCDARARFDDGKIISYAVGRAGQGVEGVAFISSRGHFLQMLKSSKRVVISVPLTGVGYKSFEFDVAGLETE